MSTAHNHVASHSTASAHAISRREALRHGLTAAGGLLLADRLSPRGQAAEPPKVKGKAKSVIQIWLWGGPSHLDTFDPKPEAGYDYCGPLDKPIETNDTPEGREKNRRTDIKVYPNPASQ